jgi:hypothetical protein
MVVVVPDWTCTQILSPTAQTTQVDGIRPEYVSDVEGFLDNWMSRYDSKTVHYTPQLLAWTNTTVRLHAARG